MPSPISSDAISSSGAISIDRLGVLHGTRRIFDDFSLELAAGDFVVLLGPSGCGKSTLLNAIAGLVAIDHGSIRIGGRDVTRAEPKDRGIGMVFQSYALYPRMTVRQNLSFGLKVARVPRAEIAERVAEAARLLQLDGLLDRRPSQLSGGQRQRVAIGRALVRHVDVFLFDEPLSNLDAQLRAELRVELKLLHRRLGSTMVFVTHDQVEAMTLADQVVVLRDGQVQQMAPPRRLYARPANLFVAGFIGSPAINLIEAETAVQDGKVWLRSALGPISLGASPALGAFLAPGRQLVLGLRPERLGLAAGDSGLHRIEGQVSLVEMLGAEAVVWVEPASGPALRLRVEADRMPAAGDRVEIAFDPASLLIYDRDSGILIEPPA